MERCFGRITLSGVGERFDMDYYIEDACGGEECVVNVRFQFLGHPLE